jgi:hemoglobin
VGQHESSTVQPTDYERVGGAEPIRHVVERFYQLVLGDPALAGYFGGVDMARLKRHQALLIAQVLGGPAEYDGRELVDAHRGKGITKTDFDRVVVHLATALAEAGVPIDIIDRVHDALGGTQAAIVEVPGD